MTTVPSEFRRFVPQLLHMITLPVFFFIFMLVYQPMDVVNVMGDEWFAVHLTIISCILLLSVIVVKLMYYFIPLRLNYTLYACWCLLEMIFASFFVALYLWLALHRDMPYFEVVQISFRFLFFAMIFPYTILALGIRVYAYNSKGVLPDDSQVQRMRFYDVNHNLKIVLTPDSIMYIASDENYVNISYAENGKERIYTLRSSMKAIDELCQENGLVRCHRSYFVNPAFVKVLRKDKEGVIYAEMESRDMPHIPVSKKYYDRLAELLY